MKTRIWSNFILLSIMTLGLFPACNFFQILPAEAIPGNTAQPSPPGIPMPTNTAPPPTKIPEETAAFISPTKQVIPTQPPPQIQPTQPAIPAPQSTDRYAVVDVAPDDMLNMRSGPGINNPIAGVIPPYGLGVEITGPSVKTNDGANWAPVRYEDLAGWVNIRYLALQTGSTSPDVAERANQIIQALKARDLQKLAAYVHPENGVRFSPYAYIHDQDLVFSQNQVANFHADPTFYLWGYFDGSGEPIQMTFVKYFDRFIYDGEFAKPQQIGFNQIIGQGNMINNLREYYPEAEFIEYHFNGIDPQYGGMDWRSMRLVLEQKNGAWYLIGVIHDEWTT